MAVSPELAHYAGPVAVTVGYVALYYGILIHILRVKTALSRQYREKGEKFDRYFGQDREMLAADRIQLNTLEHMPTFLVLLWLNAVFIGTTGATIVGSIYLAARVAYPFVVGDRLGRSVPARILLVTVPGYAVVAYFSFALIYGILS
ncbi:MAG: putative membrane protein YecN with MAPEG domain [Myxococcota bacterium]|jgi:uncharacterized membrane protein YecN with MAPEG domain